MTDIKLKNSEMLRMKLDKSQEKQISKLYEDVSSKINDNLNKLSKNENVSSKIKQASLNILKKEIDEEIINIGKETQNIISQNANIISSQVLNDVDKLNKKLGIPTGGKLLSLNKDIVEKVATGNLYDDNWTLSKSIWKDIDKTQKDINEVIAKGIAQNMSSYDIAKDLEKYVNPNVKKDWNWSKVYPGTKRKVDYSAQRLARTMVSHAYQQSLVESVKENPFVEGIRWKSAMIHDRTCEICKQRNGKVFDKDKLPLDHPNGLCTFITVMPTSDDIANRLADWVNGSEDIALSKYQLKQTNTDLQSVRKIRPVIKGKNIAKSNKYDLKDNMTAIRLMESQNFDALPAIVNTKTFNKIKGDVIYRGIGAKTENQLSVYVDKIKFGNMYVPVGNRNTMLGSGIYSTNSMNTAERFAIGNFKNILEMKLDNKAKIYIMTKNEYNDILANKTKNEFINNLLLQGYDALKVLGLDNFNDSDYISVFNRSILIIHDGGWNDRN